MSHIEQEPAMLDEQQEQPEHLDQIRDIIFGPQKREFEGRIKELEARLEDTQTQISTQIDTFTAALRGEIKDLSESVALRFQEAEEKSNADRTAFVRTILELRSAMESSFDAANQRLEGQRAKLEEQIQLLETHTTKERSELEKQLTIAIATTNKAIVEQGSMFDAKLSGHQQNTAADHNQLVGQLSSTEARFDESLQRVVQIAKENIAAVSEQVRMLEQSKNADRDELAKSLENAQHRLDKAIQNAIQSAAERTAAVDAAMRAENLRLQQELTAAKDQWIRELEAKANELTESKVSRETMAEALIELGMKVKAGERISELKLLSKKPTQ